jgi:DNA invertase Pin-like site-specific DNA recombinase
MQKIVKYFRVSTSRQAASGLGLEAQERDIQLYLENYADVDHEIVGTFTDVESGRKADRPELINAIELCKATGAILLCAKLNRLSRSVAFIATLMEEKRLEFKVASMPNADKFQLHIYAALAQQEREFISKRTKAALAAAKARGVKLGGARPEAEVRHQAVKDAADAHAQTIAPTITSMRKSGSTWNQIAERFNIMKVPTARGGKWYGQTVLNAANRL